MMSTNVATAKDVQAYAVVYTRRSFLDALRCTVVSRLLLTYESVFTLLIACMQRGVEKIGAGTARSS